MHLDYTEVPLYDGLLYHTPSTLSWIRIHVFNYGSTQPMMQDLSSPKEKGTDRWVILQRGRYYSKYKQVQL